MSAAATTTLTRTQRILHAYRGLMRAQQTAFAQDTFMQKNARKQIREHFTTKPLPTKTKGDADAQLEEQLQQAREAREFLLTSIIQARKKEEGKFVMNLQPRHTVPDPQ